MILNLLQHFSYLNRVKKLIPRHFQKKSTIFQCTPRAAFLNSKYKLPYVPQLPFPLATIYLSHRGLLVLEMFILILEKNVLIQIRLNGVKFHNIGTAKGLHR